MSFLRGSANYVWCTTSVLGKGATGAVFQGVNKNNGEPVAVKTFNQLSHMRPQEVQVREFEVLRKVKHDNIVKLLAIEEEQESRGKVIVMELCTGGSLFNILDDPENAYGLAEEEFLLVLRHLAAGMKHLRDNSLVHRDLKPGNIMRFVREDGAPVYKLTDFGAARELQEDQQFVSLYGTEEYLHPDMYERAVLRRPVGKTFGATVDLWSIGVTLYHVATGALPFRPYGGRKNKETMYYITTRKASGVISGVQASENGHIEWSRELPPQCRLSGGLRRLVAPLLAGLLEADPQHMWSFERFFAEVQERLSAKPVHVFFVNRACNLKIFLKLEDTLKSLQFQLSEQSEVAPLNQILLYKEQLLLAHVQETTPGKDYPETSAENPVMLFSRNNNSCCSIGLSAEPDIPKFPVFPNLVLVENDATQAKVACSVGHVIKRRVEMLSVGCLLTRQCVSSWAGMVRGALSALSGRAPALSVLAARLADTARALDAIEEAVGRLQGEQPTGGRWLREARQLSDDMSAGWSAAVEQLHARYVLGDALQAEWAAATNEIRCPYTHRIPQRAKTIVDKLRDSWQHLVRDRAARSLTYNDEQFHALERVKVTEAGRAANALLDHDTAPHASATAEALEDWYKVAQTVYLQSQILDKDLTDAELKLRALGARMKEAVTNSTEQLLQAVSPERSGGQPVSSGVAVSTERVDMSPGLPACGAALLLQTRAQHELVDILTDNADLITRLLHLQTPTRG